MNWIENMLTFLTGGSHPGKRTGTVTCALVTLSSMWTLTLQGTTWTVKPDVTLWAREREWRLKLKERLAHVCTVNVCAWHVYLSHSAPQSFQENRDTVLSLDRRVPHRTHRVLHSHARNVRRHNLSYSNLNNFMFHDGVIEMTEWNDSRFSHWSPW